MVKYAVTEIKWDLTDCVDCDDLPTEVTIETKEELFYDENYTLSDVLTAKYGVLVESCLCEVIYD